MSMYVAEPDLLSRAAEIARTVNGGAAADGMTGAELLDHAVSVLEDVLGMELSMWSDPRLDTDPAELAGATFELAATWICLVRCRFFALGLVLGSTVAESWPDKVEAWREHGFEVAAIIGDTSGDYEAAADYLRHYTEELLGTGTN